MYDNTIIPYTIAIDFDGTLAITDYPTIIQPKLDTIHRALKAREEGATLVLWTCRDGKDLDAAVEFCSKHGLVFDYVNENVPTRSEYFHGNSRKISADEYWDDKAVKIY